MLRRYKIVESRKSKHLDNLKQSEPKLSRVRNFLVIEQKQFEPTQNDGLRMIIV